MEQRVVPHVMDVSRLLRLVAALLLALVGSLSAQAAPTLVSDINIWPPGPRNSNPGPGVVWTGSAYFFAASVGSGYGLWKSDGTAAGTALVSDTSPFPGWDRINFPRSDGQVVFGNMLVFAGYDPAYGHELWTSDGTAGGTSMVVDLAPGESDGVDVRYGVPILVVYGSHVYFAGYDAVHGHELWRWDGVSPPTLFHEFTPGVMGTDLSEFCVAGNKLYFTVDNPYQAAMLGVTDGTSTGTQVIGSVGTSGTAVPLGNLLVYRGSSSTYGLWRSDGTIAGTYQIPGTAGLTVGGGMVAFGADVYFEAFAPSMGSELWRTDGTSPPVLVADLSPGATSSQVVSVMAFGSHVYFTAYTTSGRGLWLTDGTPAGTTLVHSSPSSVPVICGTVGNQMVLSVDYSGLWVSDGTSAGTLQIHSVSCGGAVAQLGGTLLFAGRHGTSGMELWRTDGTPAGTWLVKNINADTMDSRPRSLAGAGSTPHLFFAAQPSGLAGGTWYSMCSTDGTPATTVQHSPLGIGDIVRPFAFFGPQILIVVGLFYGSNYTLWRDDGLSTTPIWAGMVGPYYSPFNGNIVLLGGVAIVDGGSQLVWSTDFQAGQVTSAANTAEPRGLTRIDDRLFFGAVGGLFVSDGTANGTNMLSSVSVIGRPVATESRLYFIGADPLHGREVWVSDGTQAGTYMVVDLTPGPGDTNFPNYSWAAVGDVILFTIDLPGAGSELWRSDGTAAGTSLVKDIWPGALGSGLRNMSQFGDKVLFVASDGVHGLEPWISDGTPNGTVMLRDVNPGSASSLSAGDFWAVPGSGRALFTATDGTHGMEPWVTDGTSAGTRLVGDVWPGREGSRSDVNSGEFALAGRRLYFAANDGVTGQELWTLPLYFPIARPYGDGCLGSSGRPQLDTDRSPQLGSMFQVQVQRAPAATVAGLLAAFGPAYQPIAPWCHLLLASPVTVALCSTDSAGRAAVPFSLPANPAFSQVQLFFQMVVLDAGGAGPGWNLSGGLEVVVDF